MFAVVGVSGNTGGSTASALLGQGQEVRVIVRNREKGKSWEERGAEVAVAPLQDRGALEKALRGVDGLYYVIPPDITAPSVAGHYSKFITVLADVLRSVRVGHVVFLSTWTTHAVDTPFQMFREAEEKLGALPSQFTFLRASFFMENLASMLPTMKEEGILTSFLDPDRKIPMVATKDIGTCAAQALMDGPRALRTIEFTGPAEYSMNDAAGVFSRILGRSIEVNQVKQEDIVDTFKHLGASSSFANFYHDMIVFFEEGRARPEGPVTRGTTTLEEDAGIMVSPKAMLM